MPVPELAQSVAGVVLAAGSSSRMGRNKLLLEVDGEPLVRRVVGRAVSAGLRPVLVVVGPDAARVEAALAGLPYRAVPNPDHALGAHVSLRLGISRVPPTARAAVVVLADMPFVTAGMIRALVDRYRSERPRLVVSRYGEVTAPPTLYDASLFPDFARLGGDGCGRQVVRSHWSEAAFVSWPEEALADVDRPEDYERLSAPAAEG
jgi:molybdenum cofactor cytidylyltransferase